MWFSLMTILGLNFIDIKVLLEVLKPTRYQWCPFFESFLPSLLEGSIPDLPARNRRVVSSIPANQTKIRTGPPPRPPLSAVHKRESRAGSMGGRRGGGFAVLWHDCSFNPLSPETPECPATPAIIFLQDPGGTGTNCTEGYKCRLCAFKFRTVLRNYLLLGHDPWKKNLESCP